MFHSDILFELKVFLKASLHCHPELLLAEVQRRQVVQDRLRIWRMLSVLSMTNWLSSRTRFGIGFVFGGC
jgi:hypothetical protein